MELKTFLSFLFFVASAVYVVLPFFKRSKQTLAVETGHHLDDLLVEQEETHAGLSELELDYQMNKLSEEEFRQDLQELKTREQMLDKEINDEIKATRRGKTTKGTETKTDQSPARFCHNCGSKLVVGGKFCSQCGTKTT